ncbi:endoglucanase II [Coprinopsis sp. MPI-PUGE-AT-0042]|nr:endoglucanase II [Coprinopsis sp. MPI-PUGE-AT-0042]
MKPFATVLLVAASAAAHSTWQALWINDVDAGQSCLRRAANNNPIYLTQSEMNCNSATNSPNVCTIKPGDKVSVEMHAQHGDRSCRNEAIGGNHYGPVMSTWVPVDWFKVSELGLVSNNPNYWAVQVLNDNCGRYTFTVPDIAPGNYLIRAEVLALHVNVIGSGTARPPTVRFPGAYKANDPGVLININYPYPTTYIIPGPTPYAYKAPAMLNSPYPKSATWATQNMPNTLPTFVPPVNNDPGTPVVTQPPVVTSQPPVVTTQPPVVTQPPVTQPSGPLQTQWGQCGGTGWSGPTACQSPYVCKVTNDWYHQCHTIGFGALGCTVTQVEPEIHAFVELW